LWQSVINKRQNKYVLVKPAVMPFVSRCYGSWNDNVSSKSWLIVARRC